MEREELSLKVHQARQEFNLWNSAEGLMYNGEGVPVDYVKKFINAVADYIVAECPPYQEENGVEL